MAMDVFRVDGYFGRILRDEPNSWCLERVISQFSFEIDLKSFLFDCKN